MYVGGCTSRWLYEDKHYLLGDRSRLVYVLVGSAQMLDAGYCSILGGLLILSSVPMFMLVNSYPGLCSFSFGWFTILVSRKLCAM